MPDRRVTDVPDVSIVYYVTPPRSTEPEINHPYNYTEDDGRTFSFFSERDEKVCPQCGGEVDHADCDEMKCRECGLTFEVMEVAIWYPDPSFKSAPEESETTDAAGEDGDVNAR